MPVASEIYQTDVDFTSLALRYPDFAKKLKPNGQLDFSRPESVRKLTDALLARDFGLVIDLPDDRLCPPVPNRFNYIVFVQRLLDSTREDYNQSGDANRRVIGLDVGTGASAIYPLLACRQYPSWLFLSTEIDPRSRAFATRNIESNKLGSRIKIIDTDSHSKSLIPSDGLMEFQKIDVLITNPPFYSSEAELQDLAKQKSRPPNSACTGAPVEMIYPGGEVGFVTQLISESLVAPNKSMIQWFSSMFGKLGSVNIIVERLKEKGCTNYAVTEFVQGHKTRRWCVAWSWYSLRPSCAVARGTSAMEKKYLPFSTELDVVVSGSIDHTMKELQQKISTLKDVQWHWDPDARHGIGESKTGDVWSRRARRRLQKTNTDHDSMDVDAPHPASDEADTIPNGTNHATDGENEDSRYFVFRITVEPLKEGEIKHNPQAHVTSVNVRWLKGHDSTVFESFHGWLKRKLQE